MAISTLELSERQTPAAVMLTISIKAKKGREGALRKLLEAMVGETFKHHEDLVLTCTVNQVKWHGDVSFHFVPSFYPLRPLFCSISDFFLKCLC